MLVHKEKMQDRIMTQMNDGESKETKSANALQLSLWPLFSKIL